MQTVYRHLTDDWLARRASVLLDLAADETRRSRLDEDWRRRASLDLASGASIGSKSAGRSLKLEEAYSSGEREMRQRFASLAMGGQPVVVKVLGFGGSAGVRKLVSYVSRAGEIRAENEYGATLIGKSVAATVLRDWQPVLSDRKASRDIGLFEIELSGRNSCDWSKDDSLQLLRSAFADRPFVFVASKTSPVIRLEGMVVLRSASEGRFATDDAATKAIGQSLQQTFAQEAEAISFKFTGDGHGMRYGTLQLRSLVDAHPGLICDERGDKITDKAEMNEMLRRWRGALVSRRPRDTMHVVITAREGTEAARFHNMVRAFLAQEFKGHRYIFAIHDPADDPRPRLDGGKRPHIHAHAVVATVSDYGDRLAVWVSDLKRWRLRLAEHARANNINLVMTDRRETATAPGYSIKHVRPVSYDGRTEHVGASSGGQRRYNAKRLDHPYLSQSEPSQAYGAVARRNWQALSNEGNTEKVRQFARSMLARFEEVDRRSLHRSPKLNGQGLDGRGQTQSPRVDPENLAHHGLHATDEVRNRHQAGRLQDRLLPAAQDIREPPPTKPVAGPITKKRQAERSVSGAVSDAANIALEAMRRFRGAVANARADIQENEILRQGAQRSIQGKIIRAAQTDKSERQVDADGVKTNVSAKSVREALTVEPVSTKAARLFEAGRVDKNEERGALAHREQEIPASMFASRNRGVGHDEQDR
ncbi:hypothetical protein [Rhizobium terrae]|uniref:hypothetical protein n=1 Tax=Rhizobium terrae TaxID=2171756 RepID=UPI000E3C77DA|nr:hypothetical protein [Rhizobium terrae]